MVSREQTKSLEKQQVLAMRNIMGIGISERKMRTELNIETLEERRNRTLLKFAYKCAASERLKHWFPTRRVPLYER